VALCSVSKRSIIFNCSNVTFSSVFKIISSNSSQITKRSFKNSCTASSPSNLSRFMMQSSFALKTSLLLSLVCHFGFLWLMHPALALVAAG
jgi:hypothetical protein